MAFILSALGKVKCKKQNTMNNYLTTLYKRENKVITIYYQKLPFQISFDNLLCPDELLQRRKSVFFL